MDTISATEFKAKCLDILARFGRGELDRLVVTKRGRPIAVLTPPEADETAMESLHGFMRDTVQIPVGVDLTDPVCEEPLDASTGALHR